MTDDEIRELYRKNPKELTRFEYYRMITTAKTPDEREKYCREALELYDNFTYAANELAVSLFLKKKIPYLTIPDMIQASMEHHKKVDAPDVDQILAAEAETYDFIHSKWNI